MTTKEEFKNSILVAMRLHVNSTTYDILESTIISALHSVEIIEASTLPATRENSNEYIWEMFMARKAPKLSNATVTGYKATVFEFMRYINKSLLHIEESDIEYYLLAKRREGNSNVSLNNKRRKLSAFFTWMRKCHLISVNPAENIEKYVEIEKPIDHLEPEEMEQLKSGCIEKRDRAIVEWLRCTAMRGGEIPSVNINQVNWSNGTITIFGSKGHAYRLVCLDAVAMGYIKDYLAERGEQLHSNKPLFAHSTGGHSIALSRCSINDIVKKIGERAGMQRKIYTHLFRKTTATNIVRRGGSDAEAGEYLGHKPQGVTGRHYTYKSEDRIHDIFKKYVQAV